MDAIIRSSQYTKIKFYTRTIGNGIIPGRTNRHRRRRQYYGPNKRETLSQHLPPQETNRKLKNTPPPTTPKKARPSNIRGHFYYREWHYTKERPFTLNFIMLPSFETYRLNPRDLAFISPIFPSSRPPGHIMKTPSASIPTSYTPPPAK